MRKLLLVLSVAVGAMMVGGGYAGAEPAPVGGTPSSADLAKAQQAAAGVSDTVGKFLGRDKPVGMQAARPSVGGTSVPVYEITADFVRGRSTTVGALAYLAVPARGADGTTASVWTVRDASGAWTVANIASGDTEFRMAGTLPTGAVLLREPQINAWYALHGDRVQPVAGGRSMTVAEYQKLVASRYGDKLPGSGYDRSGKAGGYDTGLESPAPAPGQPWVPIAALALGMAMIGGVRAFAHR